MPKLVEWLKVIGLTLVVAVLLTRVPVIIALAQPEERELPVACRSGTEEIERQLAAAPGAVTFDGGTRLSQCLTRSSDPADVQQVSSDFLSVATELSGPARAGDDEAALRLGYLTGAVERGASRTGGIHQTMLRRIEQESIGFDDSRAYRRGERAGLRSG